MRYARYLAVIARKRQSLASLRNRLPELLAASPGSRVTLDEEWVVAIATGQSVHRVGPGAVLIGSVFARGDDGPVSLGGRESEAVVDSRGAWLVAHRWGSYVAMIGDPDAVRVVRAPFGELPCYWAERQECVYVASDLPLLGALTDIPWSIEASALARHLAAGDIQSSETCLTGVRELSGGQRLTISREGVFEETLWSPWAYASEARQIASAEDARRQLRNAVRKSVCARANEYRAILLKLSGGLDSSILAASLLQSGRLAIALNLATTDPSADEREQAQQVANRLGIRLVIRFRKIAGVDVGQSLAAHLPRPSARSFAQESHRLTTLTAVDAGCDAVFDGGGGDNVFCSLRSARPAADCLLCEDGRGAFWKTASTVAELSQAPVWRVAWRALLMSHRRSVDFRWRFDTRFLSPEARALAGTVPVHPWLQAPDRMLPGKAAHVALIAAAQAVAQGRDPQANLPTCSPLVSQPIIEECLKIASWLWFDKGHDRAVARSAFAPFLPAETIWRRSKGAPDCFVAELYEANQPTIRELLLGGELRRLGLLDSAALERALGEEGPVRGHNFLRLMQLTDAESWARCWSSRG